MQQFFYLPRGTPYLPRGSLRECLAYPLKIGNFNAALPTALLFRLGLDRSRHLLMKPAAGHGNDPG